jgi:class 3 adenylate cyclase/tetratricopeptide (TPR) repeat protein
MKFCGSCGADLGGACPACGTLCPAGQKFCGECGAALARATAASKFVSPENFTPKHLAEKILTSRSALEGERKQVTVLFADVKGSLELLADRDPEDARKLLDEVLNRMMEAVHRYEGTVNQVMGDGIMAIFGAPVAHEDHAVRACYAALRIQRRIARYADRIRRTEGLSVQVRVGANSGEVVVRSIGNDLHMDYSAVGQTTHLASRMEQIATPGSILITADTLRLAEGYVQVKSLGDVPVKGLGAPVEVFEVIGAGPVRSRLQAAAARGLTRFVGRAVEMEALREALDAAGAGQMQVAAVVGEAGVGKSRLLHEFIHSSHTRGWLVLESNSVSYGKATQYLPVIDFLKQYFKIDGHDDSRTIREKVTGKVLTLDESLQDAIPPVFELLEALPEEHPFRSLQPLQRRQHTVRAVTRLLMCESRVQPVIAKFEDLHWNDSLTLGLLKGLIANLTDARILLLVSYRPDFQDEWKTRPHYRQLRVEPLPRASIEELLRALLGADSKLAGLNEFLIERTGGNPFFLEEIVRTLVETHVLAGGRGEYRLEKPFSSVQVPATVQAVLASRIDRLSPDQKRLLQDAAVIGTDVPFALLQAIAGLSEADLRQRLAGLQSAEFIYETRLFPDLEYTFKHALTHEVAYTGLLHARRREIHARVVEAIETHYSDRLTEQVERLAHHARQGEVWGKALRYLRQAGAKAFAHSANRKAVKWSEQALDALKHLPETPDMLAQTVDLHLELRNSLTLLGEHDRTLEHLREAQTYAERIGDRYRLGRALSFEANCLALLGQHASAIESGRRARRVADELNDVALRIATDQYVGRAHLHLGDFPRAIEIFEGIVSTLTGVLELDRQGLPVLPSVFARCQLVEGLAEVGRFADSARNAAEAVALAETTNHPDTLLWAHRSWGLHYLAKRDGRSATEALSRAQSLSQTHDMPVYGPRISAELGWAWALSGRAAEALPLVKRAVDEMSARSRTTTYSTVLLLYGEVCYIAGRLDEAMESAASAMDLFRQQRERAHQAGVLRLLGDIAARQTPFDLLLAESHYREAAAMAGELGMQPLAARCDLRLGQLLRQTGRPQDAERAFSIAATRFREMGLTAECELAEAGLSGLA